MLRGTRSFTGGIAALAVVLAGGLAAAPAHAAVSTAAPLLVNEVYGGGGNSGAPFDRDFVELYNPGDDDIDLTAYSVQYASVTGSTWQVTRLSGTVRAGGTFVVGQAFGSNTDAPDVPVDLEGTIPMSGTGGKVALVAGVNPLTCGTGCAALDSVVDLVGWGPTASSYAGSGPAPATTNPTSVSRDAEHTHTADNAADFTVGAPTPQKSDGGGDPDPEGPLTIAEIQGTGAASPYVGATVTTQGVVTAAYPTGGRDGYVIQTAGTGGTLGERTASDGLFVYSASTDDLVTIGDEVRVTGAVSEFNGLTEITVTSAADLEILDSDATVTPLTGAWPATAAAREAIESMLFAPTGDLTVSNTFSTNQYGEVGLATGTTPLLQWTEVADPQDTAAVQAVKDDNAARGVVLDDGATTNYLSSANQSRVPPYVSLTNPVRVGASVTFDEPVVVTYLNNAWKLDPTQPLVGPTDGPVTFENTRTELPRDVGGDLTVASFNVLNYFTTLGATTSGCVPYTDRTGDPVTVDTGCDPRGAWDPEDLARQQAKIVTAINDLDADVVGLLEIENSAVVDGVDDEALGTLVDALNDAAGEDRWAFVPSSSDLPPVGEMDVITNALIYQPTAVERVGDSRALGTLSGSGEAFANAREPIAQAFAPVGGGEPVLVAVNHFKSKGSAGPLPGDADSGDGQGASNASRVAQATALRDWVADIRGDVEAVALVGDFNAYTLEDPLKVLYDAGYTDAAAELAPGEYSYSFGGLSGSLDHVLLNEAALERATGADVWEINAEESIALEYSRYNYHGALFYADDEYRSSDHDPVLVGLSAGESNGGPLDLTFLNINDYHGRIESVTTAGVTSSNTVKFAGTVEKLRAEAAGPVAFLSAGDNIGASLFASAVQKDQPTIDVLNALELTASAVGNHELDQGYADLTDRVIGPDGARNAQWAYLGANVYLDGTTTPALDEYTTFDMDGVTVAVIGAITEETPALVTPAGIANLDFGNPVEAVNRVAAQLTDGDESNGEADVIVAEYHEGAGSGTPDGSTLEEEVAAGGAFAEIVTETSAAVDAIFTGHTHKQYAWAGDVPGVAGKTRPIVQTGSYGEFLGKVVLTYDPATDEVVSHTEENVARVTTADETLIATYPRVAQVKAIVDEAIAFADVIGSEPVGSVTADITTAYTGGSYVDGVYVGSGPLPSTGRDDRASESTLGNLVANALRDTLADERLGGAQIGVVNPGGLRNELYYARSGAEETDGIVTFAEANAVLPFVNNLWTTTLTGEQLLTMLNQQWQRDADGNVPSRAYLQLGLSDNVSYTYDATLPEGSRITSVTIDGEPLDPEADYRVGTFSFLATGGDNFRVFTQGTDTRDSGLVDRDAWIAFLESHPDLSPDFARHAVAVSGLPSTVAAGDSVDLGVSRLDLTSLGSPQNTSLDVRLDGESIGEVAVTGGAATVAVQIPVGTSAGAHELTLVAAPSGTTVHVPLTVEAATPTTTVLTMTGDPVAGATQTLHAAVSPEAAVGTVTFVDGTTWLGTVAVRGGVATLDVQLGAGSHDLRAVFTPTDDRHDASTGTLSVTIVTTSSSTTVLEVTPHKVAFGGHVTAKVTVKADGAVPTGVVQIREGQEVLGAGTLVPEGPGSATSGKGRPKPATATATVVLPRTLAVGKHSLTAVYGGAPGVEASTSKPVTLTVTQARPTITLTTPSWTVTKGSTPVVTVTVAGAPGAPAPGGTVALEVGRTTYLGTLSGGTATFTLAKVTKTVKVTATYAGDSGYSKASASERLVVDPKGGHPHPKPKP
ncbi:ExeM/NucH family extracellular endonuclease [Cellulomonas palmilytica]|uniref:ExeM/NucH family extracellular endonuclease n=1 Tax=Cellulomonas palmilytica TaxID=2608402 RepID=UPI001F1D5E2A|nr:ExeM/NucH family extracellular endonuclease [Cellulomonas palmilytica]